MGEDVLLGYEVGTGEEVRLPLHHVVVTGLTRLSGKTTTLEALIQRSGRSALAFRTKRGEIGFEDARRVRPFFRERADWMYVQSLLEATMRERMRFERSWIIRATKGARTLEDVLSNVRRAKEKARGLSLSVYTTLEAYLELVLPQIEAADFSHSLSLLRDGPNIMDLVGLSVEVQALVIRSVLEEVLAHLRDVIVVLPEAWSFLPQRRGSPVKQIAERFIREGAVLGNLLWIDCQDLAGVDKAILKSVGVWLSGRQQEMNEVQHVLKQIPVPPRLRPKPEEIMTLPVGHFYAAFDEEVRKVYVRPAWLGESVARAVARGRRKVPRPPKRAEEDETMWKEKYDEARKTIGTLERELKRRDAVLRETEGRVRDSARELAEARTRLKALEAFRAALGVSPTSGEAGIDLDALVEKVADELARRRPQAVALRLARTESELRVSVKREIVKADEGTIRGKLALLLAEGFFDDPVPVKDVIAEAAARGWGNWKAGGNRIKMFGELKWLARAGFLRNEDKKWFLVPGAKERIHVEREQ
jgi:hypothetical protein